MKFLRFIKKRNIFFHSILFTIFISFFIYLYPSIASAYSVTLSWYPPTTKADGTPLTDLKGYKVYYGTQSRDYDNKVNVGNVTTYNVTNLASGINYYFAVTAYDKSGKESEYSNEANLARYTLTVNKSGTGKGKVTSSEAGIICGLDCKSAYKTGSVITLTATPKKGSNFTIWSGGGCEGNGQCILTMNEDTTVAANFTKENTSPKNPSTIFTVQVGAFTNALYANFLATQLKEKGYDAFIILAESENHKKLYKVCVGRFSNRDEAEALAEIIKNKEGLQAFVITLTGS